MNAPEDATVFPQTAPLTRVANDNVGPLYAFLR